MTDPLLHADDRGIACPAGGFWVDPWRPVPVAVLTHGHSDHARPGSGRYYCAAPGEPILRRRLGSALDLVGVPYGEQFTLGGVRLSFHPAGHCLGSAQVRVEGAHEVAVAAGDYKRQADPTCAPFEVVPCDTFITESTFALPIYRWPEPRAVAGEILAWWRRNRELGRVSVLCAYALGKAQRLLGELRPLTQDEPAERRRVFIHGALEPMIDIYRAAGVALPTTFRISESSRARGKANPFRGELILCPPGASASPWIRRFGPEKEVDIAFVSGWMRVRGIRRRGSYDRGFVLSDHADFNDLVRTCRETGASRILCAHGSAEQLARHLRTLGMDAVALRTAYEGDGADATEPA